MTKGNVLDETVVDPPVVKAPRRTLLSTTAAGFDDHLSEPELVSWTAPDGLEIPARLFRSGDGPCPLIVWIHGGPTDQWQVTFRPRFPFFMSRGWSILVPDHRGSTGHGRSFTQALNGRWGDADVSDVVAGIDHAVDAGWAEPDQVVVMGSSSGGATVLNILGRHPGLCAAGISLFGVADFGATAAATHRFEAHYFDTIVGPPGDVSLWRDRSPLATVEQITDPLLLLHGSDDDVVPVEQSRSIHRVLSDADRRVDLHVYRGEGHGWGRPEVVIDELQRIEGFLAEHVAASPSNE